MDPVGLGTALPSQPSLAVGWSAGLCVPAVRALLPSTAFLLPGSACALLWVKVSQVFIVEIDLSKCVYLHWGSFISLFGTVMLLWPLGPLLPSVDLFCCGCFLFYIFFTQQ